MDTNFSHTEWGSKTICKKGELIMNFLDVLGLDCANVTPHPPTFNRTHSSHIDATFVSHSVSKLISNWRVGSQSSFLSGHSPLYFSIDSPFSNFEEEKVLDFSSIDKTEFIDTFKDGFASFVTSLNLDLSSKSEVDQAIQGLSDFISTKIQLCGTFKSKFHHKKSWWDRNLNKKLKNVKSLYRKSKRMPSVDNKLHYKIALKDYKSSIKSAKKKWFSKTCHSTSNPWKVLDLLKDSISPPSHVTFNGNDGNPLVDPDDNAAYLLNKFLPNDEINQDTDHHTRMRELAIKILSKNFNCSDLINVSTD